MTKIAMNLSNLFFQLLRFTVSRLLENFLKDKIILYFYKAVSRIMSSIEYFYFATRRFDTLQSSYSQSVPQFQRTFFVHLHDASYNIDFEERNSF